MQRFMAELSSPVDKTEFERSWHSDPTLTHEPKVEFVFVGQTVSAVVHSDFAGQWSSASFHETLNAAIRRLNPRLQYPLALTSLVSALMSQQLGMHLTQVATVRCGLDCRPRRFRPGLGSAHGSIGDRRQLGTGKPSPSARFRSRNASSTRGRRSPRAISTAGLQVTARSWG
jgi:hypothetical protein